MTEILVDDVKRLHAYCSGVVALLHYAINDNNFDIHEVKEVIEDLEERHMELEEAINELCIRCTATEPDIESIKKLSDSIRKQNKERKK